MRCGCLSSNTGKMNSKTFNGACNWIFLMHWNFRRGIGASLQSYTFFIYLSRRAHSTFFFGALRAVCASIQSEIVSIWRNLTLVADLLIFSSSSSLLHPTWNFIAYTVVNLEASETTAMNVNGEQQSKKNELCSGTKNFLCAALFCFQLYLINNTSRWISFNCFYCCKCFCWWCCCCCCCCVFFCDFCSDRCDGFIFLVPCLCLRKKETHREKEKGVSDSSDWALC